MGVKFDTSVFMGKDFQDVLHVFICKSTESEIEPIIKSTKGMG